MLQCLNEINNAKDIIANNTIPKDSSNNKINNDEHDGKNCAEKSGQELPKCSRWAKVAKQQQKFPFQQPKEGKVARSRSKVAQRGQL